MRVPEPHYGPTLITVANKRHPSSTERLKVIRNMAADMTVDIFDESAAIKQQLVGLNSTWHGS